MKSVRTYLSKSEESDFRLFLDNAGLQDVKIGEYQNINDGWYMRDCICYAYSKKSDEVVAILTHISLKYGNIETAFHTYMNALMTFAVNDPDFYWTP